MSAPVRALPALAALALLPPSALAQTYDLTGLWKTNSAIEIYRVRQIDNRFYWMVDGTPQRGYANAFFGLISGTTITGYWVNMPGSPSLGSRTATLTLKIESNDRFVKQTETGYPYNGTVWTRVSDGSPPPTSTPPSTTSPAPAPSTPSSSSNTTGNVIDAGTKGWDYRGLGDDYKIGDKLRITCAPAEPMKWRALTGTNVYTSDSVVCQAAVYQGIMSWSGGTVVIEVIPGAPSYTGGEQNAVLSNSWPRPWASSFRFISGPGVGTSSQMDVATPPPNRTAGSGSGASQAGMIDAGRTDWLTVVAVDYRSKPVGTRIQYVCPPGGKFHGYVWGTDVYTGDTLVCAAAVHAGVITFADGGKIIVEIRGGQSAYHGSDRNGVPSKSFGPYVTSFAIVK